MSRIYRSRPEQGNGAWSYYTGNIRETVPNVADKHALSHPRSNSARDSRFVEALSVGSLAMSVLSASRLPKR
jgi:hypothetical protein